MLAPRRRPGTGGHPPTGTVLLTVVLLVAALAPGACSKSEDPAVDLDAVIAGHAEGLDRDGPYRDPRPDERQLAREAVRSLLTPPGTARTEDELLARLGFRATHGVDPVSDRRFSLYLADGSDERAWGALLVDRSAPLRSLVTVPHPAFDINTEKVGLSVQRRVPGSVLVIAGAHRDAAGGLADVAHNDRSLFHVLTTALGRAGLPQVQLHGFADKNLPKADVVVSSGAAPTTGLVRGVARKLEDAGIEVCRAWATRCGRLEGVTNQQGSAAAEHDGEFLHLELGWSLRREADRRDVVADAVAGQLREGGPGTP
jgi:hypothetical protein